MRKKSHRQILTNLIKFFALQCALNTSVLHAQTNKTNVSSKISGWVTSWDTSSDLALVEKEISNLDTIWFFTVNANLLLKTEKSAEKNRNLWELTKPILSLNNLAKEKNVRFGPVIHNSTEIGFDPNLALKIISKPAESIARLKAEIIKNKWRAVNIDFESLPASAAREYETFLIAIEKSFQGMDVAVSVCLHAKTPTDDHDISRFQNWKSLGAIPLDFIVMGYDHAWATSPPGPISPISWLSDVWKNARQTFSKSRLILGLPLYGYHWKKLKAGWKAKSSLASVLSEKIKKDKTWLQTPHHNAADGHNFLKKDQGISYDDDESVILKIQELEKTEKGDAAPTRIAVWRLGGIRGPLFKDLEKGKE